MWAPDTHEETDPGQPAATEDSEPPPESWRQTASRLLIRVMVPGAVALALVSILIGERVDVEHDLHLIAPSRSTAGRLPVRALLYGRLRAVEGPALLAVPVDVHLLARDETELARARLIPSALRGMEGTLEVPESPATTLRLRATVAVGNSVAKSETMLHLDRQPRSSAAVPRPVGPLQTLSLGPLHTLGPDPPSAMELRVGSGTCVPEHPCELLVHVGKPAARVRAVSSASVTPGEGGSYGDETAGLSSIQVVAHGPEAQLELVAERAGVPVARRWARLPVALATTWLAPMQVVHDAPALPRIAAADPDQPLIVDAFREDRWLRTGSLPSGVGLIPFAALEAGVWRLQARRDPFSADTAAVRLVYVRPPNEPPLVSLRTLASSALRLDPEDGFARELQTRPEAFADQDLQLLARFLFARREATIVPQPRAVSGFAAAAAELREQLSALKVFAVVSLVLSGLALGLVMARRGLSAASEARRILAEAGDEAAHSKGRRLRMTVTVLASVGSVVLAFAAIAMYVLARSGNPF